MSVKFDHKIIEKKWQDRWDKDGLYFADIGSVNKKFYNLWMFPYPSAEGLHAGHAFASTGSDIYGRFMRMNGYSVFQPIGYDSFGIHSENYAIKIGEDPRKVVNRTTKHYEEQMRSLGHGYDWTRTVTTSSPEYYRWTQWLFIQMFKSGLAYKKRASVNFCPSCKTVLADEQVMSPKAAGKEPKNAKGEIVKESDDMKVCERCGTISEKRELDQWFMRITDYADRLLSGLDTIDWSERVVKAQREWIGKKRGINITYDIENSSEKITVFTTRPDTNYGATFVVVAPENSILDKIVGQKYRAEVDQYIKLSKAKSKEDRVKEGRKKTGVFTGSYAINNLNGRRMPIWVSDFVLPEFGTGAVVGVPGHDIRDFEFAQEFHIPVVRVVVGADGDSSDITRPEQVQEDNGTMINSDFLNGMDIHKATEAIMDYMENKGWGKRVSTYHLRDWLVSRQRYWGAPIPMIHCKKCEESGTGYLLKNKPGLHEDISDWNHLGWWVEENLPVVLPEIEDYKPEGSGKGPLANHKEFYSVKCPNCGSDAVRETDVMDTFVDSSWYFLRYPSVGSQSSTKMAFDIDISKRWLPVDLYFGGAEHSVLHLMYARFVNMVMHDLGYLNHDEPFPKFFAHGLMIKDGAKMSKSRGNVVNPDEYVSKFGADTLRLYLMFMGPMDGYPDFRDSGIEGMQRFINRVWKLFVDRSTGDPDDPSFNNSVLSKLHSTIKGVTEDIESFKYNTALAKIMELVNFFTEHKVRNAEYLGILARLIAPFAPHMAEEVWVEILGNDYSVHKSEWPKFDDKNLVKETVSVVVQVNGKMRAAIDVPTAIAQDQNKVTIMAQKEENVAKYITKEPKKVIFVPGKIVNFVV